MSERKLLLDTCALIWLVAGSRDLSAAAKEAIDRADLVYVSAISAWEVSLKVAKGQLELPCTPAQWYDRALTKHRLTTAPLTVGADRRQRAALAPPGPGGRFTIAAAREFGAAVTTDRRFGPYDVAVIGRGWAASTGPGLAVFVANAWDPRGGSRDPLDRRGPAAGR